MNVRQRTVGLIALQLDLDETDILDDQSLVEDLGADSLHIIELIMALESEFKIEINDDDVEHCRTVGQIVEAVERSSRE